MGKAKKDDVKEEVKNEELEEVKNEEETVEEKVEENEEFIMSVGDADEVINEVEGDVE